MRKVGVESAPDRRHRRPGRSAGTHIPQLTDRARSHSPLKTDVNALMSGPCFRRDAPSQAALENERAPARVGLGAEAPSRCSVITIGPHHYQTLNKPSVACSD